MNSNKVVTAVFKSDTMITPGIGLVNIKVNDSYNKIYSYYGEPESRSDMSTYFWITYRQKYGVDFLIYNSTQQMFEFRLNSGVAWQVTNGTFFGDTLTHLLAISGGALQTFDPTYDQASSCAFG
jgi:hypothetical protein